MKKVKRVFLIVLDGVGCGELPDAKEFGDQGANTIGHIANANKALKLPHLSRWGLGHLTPMMNVPALDTHACAASFGKCLECSCGKDTTSGHWEMAGVLVDKPFATFPQGFPEEVIQAWVKENQLPGILGNIPASGTEILKDLGEQHLKTGKPILYTSADSVWQIAAHEEAFGLEKLYKISKSAKRYCDTLGISRVIARPFLGKTALDFKRTHNRKDYSQTPFSKTMMEHLIDGGIPTYGVGKIWNIYNGRGIQNSIETKDNKDGLETILKLTSQNLPGLTFVNLIDFDMLYGHRRDVKGFGDALSEFDSFLPAFEKLLTEDDVVFITADHGNDPTFKGTDHTREYVPLLAYHKGSKAKDLGIRGSFADIGQTTVDLFLGQKSALPIGKSFSQELFS